MSPPTPSSEERVTSHFAGHALTIEGRWVRQLCAWCGLPLVDEDLELVAVPLPPPGEPAQLPVPTWEPGAWIRVLPGCPTVYRVVDDVAEGKLPVDACTRDVAPIVLETVPDQGPEPRPASPGPLFDEPGETPQDLPGASDE